MIRLFPSISILRGKVSRVPQGDYSAELLFKESPLDFAKKFEDHGFKQIHLVDLDGANQGSPVNYHIIEAIAGYTTLKVNFTGGLNTDGDLNKVFEYGAASVTVASAAVLKKELFSSWVVSYGREKVALSADALNEKVLIKGWQKDTNIDLLEHIRHYYERSLKFVKVTDIARDGVLEGPPFELYQKVLDAFPHICLVASGGVRSVDDIKRLKDMGVYGVIFGRAYYEGIINLADLEQFLA